MNDLVFSTGIVSRDQIERMQAALLHMPQAYIVTTHAFPHGKYERTIVIPPWTVLSGAEHRTSYDVRLEKGTIAVNSDEGVKILTAPYEFRAPAGAQRVGRVFEEEVVWVDVYDNPDNCQDIAALEARLYVIPSCGLGENRVAARIEQDRCDYALFLAQLGTTQEALDVIVTNETDLIPMPDGFDVEVRPSRLHGNGLFALRPFAAGEYICPGRIEGHRTPAGRFINHSADPNTTSVKYGDDIGAVALKDILKNEEILISYRMAMRINFGLEIPEGITCQLG
jgi:hypothetical protein